MNEPDKARVGDTNVERLLQKAYQPETADPGVLPRVAEKMLAVAKASTPMHAPTTMPTDPQVGPMRERLTWYTGIAASIAGICLLAYALMPRGPHKSAQAANDSPKTRIANASPLGNTDCLTPKAKPAVALPPMLTQGKLVSADKSQRFQLPDGSLLYVNKGTRVQLDGDRRLTLLQGEVFVEVAPRYEEKSEKATFIVHAGKRQFSALGTKFSVRADEKGRTGLMVTQGKVAINGFDQPLSAGQQLELGKEDVSPTPRASHVLDWTRELMVQADSPLVPESKYTGGALVAIDPYGQEAKLELRNYKVDVHIEDGFARTVIDQTYFNQSGLRMEGTFYFPLPPDASLSRLAMYVDGNLMEGGMAERDYARSVYEEIMWSQKDPALLEWVDGSTFKMRVFPLEARQEKRIIIAYTQRLNSLYGQSQYRFPSGHSLGMVKDWAFHARVKGGQGFLCTSDSHTLVEGKPANPDKNNPPLVLKRDKTDLFVDGAQADALLGRDVVLNFVDPTGGQGGTQPRFSMTEHEGNRYLMMRWRPELNVKRQRENRDWVFLFESSGDRDPLLARVQIDVIRSLLANAEYHDTFTVLAAGTRVHHYSKQPLPVTAENVQGALQFLEGSHLIGALDLGNALTEAGELLRDRPNACLVHVGSGNPAMGTRSAFTLTQLLPKNAHYVGVGVGKKWNQHFMKLAAESTGGYYTQINPDEALSWRGFDLAATLNTPRLMDVKVLASSDSKSKFLVFANTLAQGEELCAIARIGRGDPNPPTSVTVTGILENETFKQDIAIPAQPNQADHLPRTWAKLEVDRLLAEPPTDQNRKATIELSKAMYVMTPYTSLLVLENEEMYQRFKVDRGRKDHWAQYAAPQKIDVVYDPLPGMAPDRFAPQLAKPHKNQILQTIQVRMPVSVLTWPNRQNRNEGGTTTALQVYTGAFGLMAPDCHPFAQEAEKLDEFSSDKSDRPTNRNMEQIERTVFAGERGEGLVKSVKQATVRGTSRLSRDRDLYAKKDMIATRGLREFNGRPERRASFDDAVFFLDVGNATAPTGKSRTILAGLDDARQSNQFKRLADKEFENAAAAHAPISPPPEGAGGFGGRFEELARKKSRAIDGLMADIVAGESNGPNLYGRPSFSRNEQIFRDLLAFAPGMNTSSADIEAVIEAEAAPGLGNIPGAIDAKARPMIDKARTGGWQTLTIAGSNGQPELKVLFDGQGRYAFERTTPLGLKEEVVCDGKTILHLYPDLGIGARRPVSRFHRAQFAEMVPWILPPIEDLARGVDVTQIDDRTIALVPRGSATKKDADGKPVGFHSSRLVFDDKGRLTERRLIETSFDKEGKKSEKPVYVETYDGKGAVTLTGPDGKQVSKRELKLSPAQEPSLTRDTAKLVVLPLPWRSREHAYNAIGLNVNTLNNGNENWTFQYLDSEKATVLLAAEFSAQDSYRVQQILRRCFLANGINKPGFWTLLAAMDHSIASDPAFLALAQANPGDPLLNYLTLVGSPVYRSLQSRFALRAGERIGTEDSFLRRHAAFYDLYTRWQFGNLENKSVRLRRLEQSHGLEFVRKHKSSVLGWAALTLLQDRAWENDFHRQIAEAWKLFDDGTELGYAANYEHARNLYAGGKPAEAAKLYRQMYERFLKEKILPPIDHSFREALLHPDLKADQWTDLMQKTSAALLKDNQRVAVITIAWQCYQLGDQPLAENMLNAALANLKDSERLAVTLAAVDYLMQTSQDVRADSLVTPLLETGKNPMLWRLASQVAERRNQTARSIGYLEQALEIEFASLPEVVNLQQVRNDYGRLLNHYDFLARAVSTMKIEAPKDLAARTIRAADRWRMLDRDNTQPCHSTASILKILGAREMAWDYLTTPIGMKPSDSGPWQSLAQTLSHQGDLDLADIAYTAAFQAEPTDAQILWNKAQNLQRQGKKAEANKVLQEIVAKNDWQPRFNWIKSQARWQLEGR